MSSFLSCVSNQIQRQDIEKLRKDGIVMIEDYYKREECEDARQSLIDALESGNYPNLDEWDGDDFLSAEEPVINRRGGADEGMIDFGSVDQIIDLAAKFRNDEFIMDLLNEASSKTHTVQSVNAYINRNVTSTRTYHADTYGDKFKAFLYLTNVPTEDYGPYSYIKGSHKTSTIVRNTSKIMNKVRGERSTNAIFYDESDVVKCKAPKGTLIISNQSGYHRGIPQTPKHERMLLNLHITPSK